MLVTDTTLILAEDNASQRRQVISSPMLSSTYTNNSDLDSVGRHPIHGANMKTKYTRSCTAFYHIPCSVYKKPMQSNLSKSLTRQSATEKRVLTLTH